MTWRDHQIRLRRHEAEAIYNMREVAMPVREEIRDATGMNKAITDGFCMSEDIKPAESDVIHNSRLSSPFDLRSSHPAKRLRAPVRSKPAPKIIVAMMLITGETEQNEHDERDDIRPEPFEDKQAHRQQQQPEYECHFATEDERIFHASGVARVQQIKHGMAQALAACFEMRLRTPRRARHMAARPGRICETFGHIQHIPHVLRIIRPVGRQMQPPAGRDLAGE